ncbi:MAG: succinate--CoA ligase subunit alpha [Candidatus Latescibacterota bacterium]|nr:MAG: succinate--CoA ligase subunit alpha [Candidatus Latescibacterota bacterium]
MSILVDKKTRLVVQGITGRDGSFHTREMIAYGTNVVAGVTPGKGGEKFDGVPIFDTVREAVLKTKANASVIFVPPAFATDAMYEAIEAGIKTLICISEGIPALDMIGVYDAVRRNGVHLVGPNCPGVISPGKAKVGIMPGPIHKKGPVGVVSRSGTLTYEVVASLMSVGLGQSTCIGIGGDPIVGSTFLDLLPLFEGDPETKGIVLIGEIGGMEEERAAAYIAKHVTKPVIAFIAGRTAPPGKRMGHAGAIIAGGKGTAEEKIAALGKAKIPVAKLPSEIGPLMKKALEAPRSARGVKPSSAKGGGKKSAPKKAVGAAKKRSAKAVRPKSPKAPAKRPAPAKKKAAGRKKR